MTPDELKSYANDIEGYVKECKNNIGDLTKQMVYPSYAQTKELLKGFVEKIRYATLEKSEIGGMHGYLFCLSVTYIVGSFGSDIVESLWKVLVNYRSWQEAHPNAKETEESLLERDCCFTAFYVLSVLYNRNYWVDRSPNKLTEIIADVLGATTLPGKKRVSGFVELFIDHYPLVYEALSRYCETKYDYTHQVIFASMGLQLLEQRRIENIAVKAGFVSGVCSLMKKDALFPKKEDKSLDICKECEYKSTICSLIKQKQNIVRCKLDENYIATAKTYIDDLLRYNPNYGKYYYFKAQYLFYKTIIDNNEKELLEVLSKTKDEVKDLIEKAISLENKTAKDYVARCAMYNDFVSVVEEKYLESMNRSPTSYADDDLKEFICKQNECPTPNKRPPTNILNGDDSFVFISYSTKDFRQVYCDIIDYKRRSVKFWYDKDIASGQNWDSYAEPILKKSDCIICYLSENSIVSENVMNEIRWAKENNREVIYIDLTGKIQISQILADVIYRQTINKTSSINSDTLSFWLTTLSDKTTVTKRDIDPKSNTHIEKICQQLKERFPNTVGTITSEINIWQNNKEVDNKKRLKPCEDFADRNDTYNIYGVADGITRKFDKGYTKQVQTSQSKQVSELFVKSMIETLEARVKVSKSYLAVKAALAEAFSIANKKVGKLVKSMQDFSTATQYVEPAGCVGVVAVIFGEYLCYGSIGDCVGMVVRNKQRIVFAKKQTTYAFQFIEGLEADRKKLYEEVANVPNCDHSYGVVNGNENAFEFFKISHLHLEKGDTVFLMSDGISDFLENVSLDTTDIVELPLEKLRELSDDFDNKYGNSYHDDKALIRIKLL